MEPPLLKATENEMNAPESSPYSVQTRPCLIEVGRFRWDIYSKDALFQSSAEAFDTEQEARANGMQELERLPIP
jgi:hypothetical protein